MSLPSSGQISFSNVATEMGQTGFTAAQYNYWMGVWGTGYSTDGYPYNGGFNLAPINVNTANAGKYSDTTPIRMSDWYGYNQGASYSVDGIDKDLFFSISPAYIPLGSSLIKYDVGTSNKTLDISISGSIDDFDYVQSIVVYYGQPWQSNSLGTGSASVIYAYTGSFYGGFNTLINDYAYTYDSGKGSSIYVVIYAISP